MLKRKESDSPEDPLDGTAEEAAPAGKEDHDGRYAEKDAPRAKQKSKKKRSHRHQEEELEKALGEAESLRDSLLRLQAEFENFKKRQTRDKEEIRRNANERLLEEMLPVLDNLERAVEHGGDQADAAKILEGVLMVTKQFRERIAQFGVEPIEALGEVFDPHVHEAMSRVDTDGDPPDGTVVEVYQRGYLLNGRVLRPAMVGVAKIVDGGTEGEGD